MRYSLDKRSNTTAYSFANLPLYMFISLRFKEASLFVNYLLLACFFAITEYRMYD